MESCSVAMDPPSRTKAGIQQSCAFPSRVPGPSSCFPFRRHSLVGKQMDTLGIEPRASRMLSGCDTTTPCAPLLLEVVAVQRRMSSRQGTTSHPQRFTAKLPRQRFCAAPSFVAQLLLTSMICPVAESHTFLSLGQLQCGWGACPCGVHVAEADDVHAWQQGLCVASWCNG